MGWTAFERGSFLTADDRPRWQAWAQDVGRRILRPWTHDPVEAAVLRPVKRHSALDAPGAPRLLDVGGWALCGRWWLAFGVVMATDEVVFEVDALRRGAVRSVGVGHHDREDRDGDPLQVEFDIDGPGFAGLAGRRWSTADGALIITEGGDPVLTGPGMSAEIDRFLQKLVA